MREGARYLFIRRRSEGSKEWRKFFLDEERRSEAGREGGEVSGGNADRDYSSVDPNPEY